MREKLLFDNFMSLRKKTNFLKQYINKKKGSKTFIPLYENFKINFLSSNNFFLPNFSINRQERILNSPYRKYYPIQQLFSRKTDDKTILIIRLNDIKLMKIQVKQLKIVVLLDEKKHNIKD